NDIKNLQRIPGQIGLIHYSMLSQTGQSHHPLIRREDIDPEYEKAVKKLKENEKKIKILLERQQMDGKISDAKERIEKLERIIQFKEKASLNYINRFINATDAKIKDENLCKPVIDAFDHIVKAGDKYKNFRIPHYDPFYCIKEKLGVPDYIKYARPDDDTDPTPYYLRETNCDDVKEKIIERSGEKEKSADVSKINVGERELEILEEIDEKSKLVIGEDSKEHLVILCGNERYLVLSEIITKDLKSCGGKFKVDPESIPISDHCREINIIITFDTIGVPPLHLLVPIDYPKDFCTIINPNFNEVDRDVLLCRLISKVEQALPCLPINRDIQNIVNTWKKLSMTCN
uniref:Vacuolar protein sorting-associated protein 29 n=1 Tax=Strongyloides venezuelensis TaxID=75913 RepID=A0A0K0FX35_STRVS